MRGGFTRKGALTRWTAQRLNIANTNISGTDFSFDDDLIDDSETLVFVSDYQQSDTLEPDGATVVRVRGFAFFDATVLSGSQAGTISIGCSLGIVAAAEGLGITTFQPALVGNLIRNEWLWTYQTLWFFNPGATAANSQPIDQLLPSVEIDVKAKRKLQDENLYLVAKFGTVGVDSGVSLEVTVTGYTRILLRGRF